jgi:rhodanese-related sulfurtransferase
VPGEGHGLKRIDTEFIAVREPSDKVSLEGPVMIRKLSLAIALLAVVGLSAPVLASEAWPDSVDQYVLQIRKSVKTADMDGYLAAVKNPNGAVLLDVREDEEFKTGHVPGSVNIPRGLLEFRIWKYFGYPTQVDMTRKIYVQCQTGGRATLAAKQLQDIGFTNVIAVVMNFEDWKKKGNPLS